MNNNDNIVEVKNVSKFFQSKSTLLSKPHITTALLDVSLDIPRKSIFGIVGPSGSGKSTLASIIGKLLTPSSGTVLFNSQNIHSLKASKLFEFRRKVQTVFQDSLASLNPTMTIQEILEEPLLIHKKIIPFNKNKITEVMDLVELDTNFLSRRASELSGGQRQRVNIARTLTLTPELIIADEPVSSLDRTSKTQILNLIQTLQKTLGISFLIISHDLSIIHHLCTQIGSINKGEFFKGKG